MGLAYRAQQLRLMGPWLPDFDKLNAVQFRTVTDWMEKAMEVRRLAKSIGWNKIGRAHV